MKTRDELLAMAEEALLLWDARDGEYGTSKATFAQACVMLAKERRESEQIERLVDVMLNVQWAIQSK